MTHFVNGQTQNELELRQLWVSKSHLATTKSRGSHDNPGPTGKKNNLRKGLSC